MAMWRWNFFLHAGHWKLLDDVKVEEDDCEVTAMDAEVATVGKNGTLRLLTPPKTRSEEGEGLTVTAFSTGAGDG